MEVDAHQLVADWWNRVNPDTRAKADDIESGLRAPTGEDSQHITVPCQYWIKGLPIVCIKWDGSECSEKEATGWNGGLCDGLGRNDTCSMYASSLSAEDIAAAEEDPFEEYVCVLPCLSRSGFGKQVEGVSEYVFLRSFKPDEIKGYNEEEGVGKCDGLGMGRGKPGFGLSIAEIYKLRPVCRH